ncbi:hypothetical protein C5F61_16370 [Photobacterium damselae subsp. damselae]|nr:hypothetical protein C5F61_16370 [Photobacterium damselae subsp. damselae]
MLNPSSIKQKSAISDNIYGTKLGLMKAEYNQGISHNFRGKVLQNISNQQKYILKWNWYEIDIR